MKELTRDGRNLLLYLETRCVDYRGLIDPRRMNEDDFKLAREWDEEGFIKFGRIAFADCKFDQSHWCELSEEAWTVAHVERQKRFSRMVLEIKVERLH
jgi:hypothetical protein